MQFRTLLEMAYISVLILVSSPF